MTKKQNPFYGGEKRSHANITLPRVRGQHIGQRVVLGRSNGGFPKKMTKGLRRQLEKVARQNPEEAERQRRLIGQ